MNQSRACLNCQRRKSRCQPSPNGPGPCSYCTRAGKDCSFVNPPNRTRLTRKNLDAVELRCSKLQALIRSLHPDLDIDLAISNLEGGQDITLPADAESDDDSPEHQEPAHEFEWNEASAPPDLEDQGEETGGMDGMATLNSYDAGYLGKSFGLWCNLMFTSLRQQLGCQLATRDRLHVARARGDELPQQ
jgi:transcriptional regulatory protein GAL4